MISARLAESHDLLRRAATFTLDVLARVAHSDLGQPSPCLAWDLRALLVHLTDSADALTTLLTTGSLELGGVAEPADPVAAAGAGITRLVAAVGGADVLCSVGGQALWASTASRCGAVELALHGWDIGRSLGLGVELPAPLAEELLDLAHAMVLEAAREPEFGPAVPVPGDATPTERLVGFLGRR